MTEPSLRAPPRCHVSKALPRKYLVVKLVEVLALILRNDQIDDGASDGFLGRIAEYAFGRPIPGQHHAGGRRSDNRNGRRMMTACNISFVAISCSFACRRSVKVVHDGQQIAWLVILAADDESMAATWRAP